MAEWTLTSVLHEVQSCGWWCRSMQVTMKRWLCWRTTCVASGLGLWTTTSKDLDTGSRTRDLLWRRKLLNTIFGRRTFTKPPFYINFTQIHWFYRILQRSLWSQRRVWRWVIRCNYCSSSSSSSRGQPANIEFDFPCSNWLAVYRASFIAIYLVAVL